MSGQVGRTLERRSGRGPPRRRWRPGRATRASSPGEASGVVGAGGARSALGVGRLATTLPAVADRMAAMLLLDAGLPEGFAAPWPGREALHAVVPGKQLLAHEQIGVWHVVIGDL